MARHRRRQIRAPSYYPCSSCITRQASPFGPGLSCYPGSGRGRSHPLAPRSPAPFTGPAARAERLQRQWAPRREHQAGDRACDGQLLLIDARVDADGVGAGRQPDGEVAVDDDPGSATGEDGPVRAPPWSPGEYRPHAAAGDLAAHRHRRHRARCAARRARAAPAQGEDGQTDDQGPGSQRKDGTESGLYWYLSISCGHDR